ncbi:aliphatic sulfonate ABC transporter substrate-binding protein [Rhizobium lemnae]|uniref:Aliphatic sulfonate ABC transporter substrate-binding protein n=1 Tax=Rhizobium lemnae TaxID=1214924 RepID=A0ABV8EAP4_9HYPH|nr:aliphatic sulfonate ABC transporter substrate-binding protein [Rhizobium lemnae]MCJ8507031.1 aliphatic sulfonate ABC transporter substrate-binding protein [Rhizobium lemnae]
MKSILRLATAIAVVAASHLSAHADQLSELRIDWATYNPVSLILKNDRILEKELEKDGIKVTWVQSAGSNKALEFLSAGSLDFGSTAGAAALIGRINGNPIKSIYVYSKPEWTALVTRKDTGISKVADLKGKSIAVTRGTDPHIFLVRALADAGLTEKDVSLVLLQHADGRLALKRGDVAAWAGLDPIMASAEIEDGDVLFHRNAANNTWGVLNVREEFARQHPDVVKRVLKAYEQARAEAQKNPAKLKSELVAATKLPDEVIARQLERTDLTNSAIGKEQASTIEAAGVALQKAGVLKPEVDVAGTVSQLIDASYLSARVGQ